MAKEKITVTVSYPVTFEVPESLISSDDFETQERIKDYADKIFESSPPSPIITDCSNEDYIE